MYANPYHDMKLQEIYDGLISGQFGPRWPDEKLQKGYAGTNGVALLRRAFDFIGMLEADGAFVPDWKGLDYGCGWGRFPSTLLSRGRAEQLDACDAWPHTLQLIGKLGYQNRVFKIPEIFGEGDLEKKKYDFALSFSVFTHLAPRAFEANIPVLRSSLKQNGKLYVTVRHEEFLEHFYKERAAQMRKILE